MRDLLDAITSWRTLVVALVVFGFAPGAVLRLILLAYHRDDPRRRELRAELHIVPRWERPFWVVQQLEEALFDGLWPRLVWAATGRIIYRWRLGSGVKSNREHPDTFEIPDEEDKDVIVPGDHVKLMFEMRTPCPGEPMRRWGARLWVDVTEVKQRSFVGRLRNDPYAIPRLEYGGTVKFKRKHIIDIHWTGDDDHDLSNCPLCRCPPADDDDQELGPPALPPV
jgi:hypothetical protein